MILQRSGVELALLLAPLAPLAAAGWQLPRWQPVWQLNRSTIAQPCNNSGWLGPELPGGGDIGEFGLLSFDWANHRAVWSAEQPNRCEEDLITQAIAAKNASARHPGPETKVFVYRGGEMCLNVMTDQRELMGDLASHPSGSFTEYVAIALLSAAAELTVGTGAGTRTRATGLRTATARCGPTAPRATATAWAS